MHPHAQRSSFFVNVWRPHGKKSEKEHSQQGEVLALSTEQIQFINAMLVFLNQSGELRIICSGGQFDQIYIVRTTIYDVKQIEGYIPG